MISGIEVSGIYYGIAHYFPPTFLLAAGLVLLAWVIFENWLARTKRIRANCTVDLVTQKWLEPLAIKILKAGGWDVSVLLQGVQSGRGDAGIVAPAPGQVSGPKEPGGEAVDESKGRGTGVGGPSTWTHE